MVYNFPADLVAGTFLRRLNRFAAAVQVNGQKQHCHIPNSGRMRELLHHGTPVMLQSHQHAYRRGERKTPWELFLVKFQGEWVSVDSRLPNLLLQRMLDLELFPEGSPVYGARFLRREPAYGRGRFDAELASRQGDKLLVECKSVTLVTSQVALFPDAPTERGKRHLEELAQAVQNGWQALVLFLVQRNDASCFRPNWQMDPAFSQALTRAVGRGVFVESYAFHVDVAGVASPRRLPVFLTEKGVKCID